MPICRLNLEKQAFLVTCSLQVYCVVYVCVIVTTPLIHKGLGFPFLNAVLHITIDDIGAYHTAQLYSTPWRTFYEI